VTDLSNFLRTGAIGLPALLLFSFAHPAAGQG